MNNLRPHDVAVALQLALNPGTTYAALAAALGLSVGEAHNAVRRLITARLVRRDDRAVNRGALLEFLVGGVPYAFAAEPGAILPGVPTAISAPVFASVFVTEDRFVWPAAARIIRGCTVAPLWANAPGMARTNVPLYELLAAIDTLRIGRTREKEHVRKWLRERLAVGPSPVP